MSSGRVRIILWWGGWEKKYTRGRVRVRRRIYSVIVCCRYVGACVGGPEKFSYSYGPLMTAHSVLVFMRRRGAKWRPDGQERKQSFRVSRGARDRPVRRRRTGAKTPYTITTFATWMRPAFQSGFVRRWSFRQVQLARRRSVTGPRRRKNYKQQTRKKKKKITKYNFGLPAATATATAGSENDTVPWLWTRAVHDNNAAVKTRVGTRVGGIGRAENFGGARLRGDRRIPRGRRDCFFITPPPSPPDISPDIYDVAVLGLLRSVEFSIFFFFLSPPPHWPPGGALTGAVVFHGVANDV